MKDLLERNIETIATSTVSFPIISTVASVRYMIIDNIAADAMVGVIELLGIFILINNQAILKIPN
jgi:hypothetical protein